MQAYKDLVKALPGLKEDMPRAFYMLAELFDYGSFDICRSDDKYIIPYIMNDAVECYLTVENAVLKGDYHSEEEIISASLVLGSEKGYGLILHQQDNVVTLWFDNLHVHEACFKYHEIGHFWVKGQEQWRMLVYMVGTIADKYMYMGKEYCNETMMMMCCKDIAVFSGGFTYDYLFFRCFSLYITDFGIPTHHRFLSAV